MGYIGLRFGLKLFRFDKLTLLIR